MEIRILRRQGKSIRSIATELPISRETVRKYLRPPGLAPGFGPRATRGSKLDPFKTYTRQRLRPGGNGKFLLVARQTITTGTCKER